MLEAANGKHALNVYRDRQENISLIVLDLVMPEMGGKQCLEELLKMNPRAKVLITSGYSSDGAGDETTNRGALGFIGKPFDRRQFLQEVRKVLDRELTVVPM